MRKRLVALAVLVLILTSSVCADEFPVVANGPFFVGSKIYPNTGVPADGMGLDGDVALDTTAGTWYNKTGGTWDALFQMISPTTVSDWIAGNKTDTFNAFQTNLSALNATIDLRIVGNMSTGATAAQILEIENQFGLNDTSTLNQAIISASANTSSTAPAVLAATPLITGNRTGAVNDALSSTWTNLSLLINATYSDEAKSAAIKWASDSDTANDTHWHNEAILAAVANDTAAGMTAANMLEVETQFAANDTSTLNQGILAHVANDTKTEDLALKATWTNLSLLINGTFKAEAIKWASDSDTANDTHTLNEAILAAVANDTAAGMTAANWVEVEDQIKYNDSATVRTAAEMALLNRTTAERTAASMQTANLSELSHWGALNRTEIFAGTWTNLSLLINSSYRTGAVNDAAVAAKANRTLWGNFSVMASSMVAGTGADSATLYAPNTSLGVVPVTYIGFPRGVYNASVNVLMPTNYAGGTLTATFLWSVDSGAGTVEWDWEGRCGNDNSVIHSYMGANQTILDTVQTKDYVHISDPTAATTLAGTPQAGAYCLLNFRRLSGAGTLSTEARLLGVRINYGTY